MMHLISVVVVDDHALVRRTLRSILEDYPDLSVVGEASNGQEAIEVVERSKPNIVVMDIDMPVMNGIEATTQIRGHHPDILVIGLSVTTHRDFSSAMIRAGAERVLPKEAVCEQLHTAITLAVQRAARINADTVLIRSQPKEAYMKKVLVIDDELGIRGLLATILERKGYEVLLAESGRKGLDLFSRERPDVIVLDLKLPEMDGITVLQDIRGMDTKTPVVVLTGARTETTERQARELGVAAFIEKGFSLHRLEETLRRLLPAS